MGLEYKECLQKQKIRKFIRGRSLASKELRTAESDLKRAGATCKQKDYKWATIQGYYAMFHSARALLYQENFRERSHYCLIIALRELYVKTKILDASFIETLQRAKILRENADYYERFSKESAGKILDKAEEFLDQAKKIFKIR